MNKYTLAAIMVASSFSTMVMAEAPGGPIASGEATTEIHWSGKVPFESNTDGVIMTALGGTPLTPTLKGGDLFLETNGSFKSSTIPLELHYRTCLDSDGVVVTTNGVCDTGAGGTMTWGEEDTDIGDLIVDTSWKLINSRYTVGGVDDPASPAKINLDGEELVTGTAKTIASGVATFSTVSEVSGTEVIAPNTQYGVYASVLASFPL